MDKLTAPAAPYFDPIAVGAELASLHETVAGDEAAVRRAVVEHLRALIKRAHAAARVRLEADGDGRRCAEGLTLFTDTLVRLIYDYVTGKLYRAANPSTSERLAVVATGGYGRGLMAPRSDIDLLFLLPYKQTPWGESVVEAMLYLLWDTGLKVGHATRNVEQCIRLSGEDMTIRTALLDSRILIGDAELFAELDRRFRREVVRGSEKPFIAAKLAERDERYRRSGESRYRVEPNVKDGKGGLRDLHTLHWLMKYLHDAEPGEEAVETGLFTAAEYHMYRKCEDFLWTVRCHLHFLANRAEERLTFDMQPMMSERLGYTAHGGLRGVERFMKHYFLVAKEVGDLTLIACAALEMRQLKAEPVLERLLAPLTWHDRALLRRRTDFRIDNGRLNVARADAFRVNPVNLIRIFKLAEEYEVAFHPEALRLARHSLRLIDDRLRHDIEANRIFLDLLTARTGVERTLRRMSEAGVLGRFVPEFGRVVAMMQFNMYHHYTVDEHLIRSVGILNEIEVGRLEEEHPLATQIIHDVQNRRALYVAQFLHDVGKGRREDHSIVGARLARNVCPRLGLSRSESETVAWLIENHLVMSTFAQSRDLSDPKTIRDFADIVQSPERLRLLLILTVADIRAVGPGVWNGWKGQLLRTLYYETEPVLAGGHSRLSHGERIAGAEAALKERLADWPRPDVERFVARLPAAYWLRTDLDHQVEHAHLMRKAEQQGAKVATQVKTDAFTAITELTVLAPNVPRLLAMFIGTARPWAPIFSAPISRRPRTGSRSTPSCSSACSTRPTSAAARAASPTASRS
ncbi:MAG: [protein-PII] uridylyltransferase [Hyphomicrobiaceae bacterium]